MKKNVLWIFLLLLAILMTFSAAADTVACSSGTIIQRTQTGDKILGLAVSITSGQSLITS